tara:strand:+ start:933 stop:1580 length:648 start_codon:yes stop_codon:yes gene_type:complete
MPSNEWIATLKQHGCTLDADQIERIGQYCFLVRKWSTFSALVSSGNLEQLEDLHIVDSFSLVDPVSSVVPVGGMVLDIGSGGGFPAIPMAIALPDRYFTLMERSAKKVSFLRKVMGALKLDHVQLIHGTFPDELPEEVPHGITARAVERSDAVMEEITGVMPENCTFFCQSGDPKGKVDENMFHVERWQDEWTKTGARRGTLYTIRRRDGVAPAE